MNPNKKRLKNAKEFKCETCDFICFKKCDWDRHISTRKHENLTNPNYLGINIPVIIISSNHELDKIKASYEKGCNDYIKKPFFIYELVQKVKNLCTIDYKFIDFNDNCKYNFIEHTLYVNEEKIILARKEILFLELFITNLNRIVTYHEIENYVWEGEDSNIDNIRALIKRIRKKLPEESIKIVTGYGYTLNKDCKYS